MYGGLNCIDRSPYIPALLRNAYIRTSTGSDKRSQMNDPYPPSLVLRFLLCVCVSWSLRGFSLE